MCSGTPSGPQIVSAEATELFVGPVAAPQQVVRVGYLGATGSVSVRVDGDGLTGEARTVDGDGTLEVPVTVDRPVAGQRRAARVGCVGAPAAPDHAPLEFDFTVAEPGWTMFTISHFHYDPMWWNTQGAYTSEWTEQPPGACRQTNGLTLVAAHLEMARRDPEYKFVLAEVDYLKPYWDTRPADRADLHRLIAEGRVEIMGGTYNEPNTNLTSPETTIRNLMHGSGFQRDVLGAEPATAWQLDVFGHDPQFPGMAADAGLTSSSWARGPHHQWGPMASRNGLAGDVRRMRFCSEFEWFAPAGRGLLTHYMPGHYSAGRWMDSASSLDDAEQATYRLFTELKKVAATRNVLLPVGTDYTPPNTWLTEIHRDWNARYTWPKFVCAVPAEFFAAVRAELAADRRQPTPQTRDMTPIYTGKDVSYIDTKQANRAAENAVLTGERFAVFATVLTGAEYPEAAFAKAWVQLAYSAHHDGITGSESDQVYLDLSTGWRDAWQLGRAARDNALALLSRAVGGAVVVWNSLAHNRTEVATARFGESLGAGVRLFDADGVEVPAYLEHDGRSVSFLARDVPRLGWRMYRVSPGPSGSGWEPVEGTSIANEHYRLTVDPARDGSVVALICDGRELITAGRIANELAVYPEYSAHPQAGEGPWHLLPSGPVVGSAAAPAQVQAYRSPLGERLVVSGRIDTLLRYTQTLTLWHGLDRVDCHTRIDEFTGEDRLLRLRWPCQVAGAMPVSEVGDAVVGRGFALLHDLTGRSVDTAHHPWTLDNPCHGWFGLSAAARVKIGAATRAISVAEVVTPTEAAAGPLARDLMVALVRAGVTATCSSAERPCYGHLDVDSNLPDTRITLGGPTENTFTAAVLAAVDPGYAAELAHRLADTGQARVWVPAATTLAAVWRPNAELRDPMTLPVLIIAGRDAAGLAAAVAADLGDAEISVNQRAPTGAEPFESRTVAVLNRGVPSFAVEADGTLHTALLRSCTGWPSGAWTDPPRRTTPDDANFALQHWTHDFDYALVAGDGDWRAAEIPARSAGFGQPLLAVGRHEPGAGLPASGSLLGIEAAGAVQLAALKAAGNPLTRGSAAPVDPAVIAVRLVETHGADAHAALDCPLGSLTRLGRADLLERPYNRAEPTTLHGYRIVTLLAELQASRLFDADAPLGPHAEAAQPLYVRYWLHNRGPAPLGGLPAVAYLHPRRVDIEPGVELRLGLTAVSDCTDATLSGSVTLVSPNGWSPSPATLPVTLSPGGHLTTDLAVTVPADAQPGWYPIRAQLRMTGDGLPACWRQVVEDVTVVRVGASQQARLLYLVDGPAEVELAPGESARLRVIVGTDARADLAAEAHLISRWGTVGMDRSARPRRGAAGGRHRRIRLRRGSAGLGGAGHLVGAGPGRLRRRAGLFTSRPAKAVMIRRVATVGGAPVRVAEVDAREAQLRRGPLAAALPAPDTSEGRQLRRWLTQLIVTERVVAAEAAALGLTTRGAPAEAAVLPDAVARLEIASVAAMVLAEPLARAVFAHVTAAVEVGDDEVAGYHARNPLRFAAPVCDRHGWRTAGTTAPPLGQVQSLIAEQLRGAARRRAFRMWLDIRRAALVRLAAGYEHPGDPRQSDSTHRH